MATDRVIMGKTVWPLFLGCFSSDIFIHAGNNDMHESSEEFCPLAAEKIPRLIMGKTVPPLFLGCF